VLHHQDLRKPDESLDILQLQLRLSLSCEQELCTRSLDVLYRVHKMHRLLSGFDVNDCWKNLASYIHSLLFQFYCQSQQRFNGRDVLCRYTYTKTLGTIVSDL
jgi:hypothetical protein